MLKKSFSISIILAFVVLVLASTALAQSEDEGLRLRISKVIGYGSFGNNEFQGTIKVWIDNPENLSKVIFYIDDQVMGEAAQAPFALQFNTGNYSLGEHRIVAVGTATDGQELRSNEIRTSFVSPERGMQVGLKILIPLLGIILAAFLIGTLGPVLLKGGKNVELPYGAERKYGVSGGAICPRCQRPFSMNFFGLNLIGGRLDRCPYCGKWALMRRRSLNELRAAEVAELEMARKSGLAPAETEEEKLRKDLENSRYY